MALLAAVRQGGLVARPSFYQLKNVREARAAGVPMHLIVHEDVLIFRTPPTSGNTPDPALPGQRSSSDNWPDAASWSV